MTLTVTRPCILSIKVDLAPEDRHYDSCLSAKFDFDCDAWRLNISGDAGDFMHRWEPEDDRTFFEMLAVASSEYLMRKLGTEVFSLSKSIEQTLTKLETVCSASQEPELFYHVRLLGESWNSEEVFYNCARGWLKDRCLYHNIENMEAIAHNTDYFVCLAKEFPRRVTTIVDIFDACIRPELKRMNREAAAGEEGN